MTRIPRRSFCGGERTENGERRHSHKEEKNGDITSLLYDTDKRTENWIFKLNTSAYTVTNRWIRVSQSIGEEFFDLTLQQNGGLKPLRPFRFRSTSMTTMSVGSLWKLLFALSLLVTNASAFRATPAFTKIARSSVVTFRHMAAADVLDRPATIEIIKEDKAKQSEGTKFPDWEVRLWNDPYNKREFVARCLSEVCGKSDTESYQIMMHAHQHGMGTVGRYVYEIAELYHASLKENGLLVDMIPLDDE